MKLNQIDRELYIEVWKVVLGFSSKNPDVKIECLVVADSAEYALQKAKKLNGVHCTVWHITEFVGKAYAYTW